MSSKSKTFINASLGIVAASVLGGLSHASGGNQPETGFDCLANSEPYQIAYGTYTENGAFELSTDIDVFEFHGVAGDVIRIRFLTLNVDLDPRVCLYGPDNQLLACDSCVSDRFNLCSFEFDESDLASLPLTGTYRIVVEELGVNNAGSYTFQLEQLSPRPADRRLPYNTPTRDTLGRWTDLDGFSFCAVENSLLRLSFLTLNVDIDPRIEIRDPTGVILATPGCDSDRFNLCSLVHDFTAPMTGEYRLFVYDAGVNNPGAYEVSVNCLVGCPPLASSLVRNGGGTNPLAYRNACPPVLGGIWEGQIDCNGFPGATRTAVFSYQRALVPGTQNQFGELLVDPNSPAICHPIQAPVDADGISRHRIAIPCTPSLAGLRLASQGVILGSAGPKLTNAIDIIVGY